jgi:hypothetical protein
VATKRSTVSRESKSFAGPDNEDAAWTGAPGWPGAPPWRDPAPGKRRPYPSDLSDPRWELIEPVPAAWRFEHRGRALDFARPPEHDLRDMHWRCRAAVRRRSHPIPGSTTWAFASCAPQHGLGRNRLIPDLSATAVVHGRRGTRTVPESPASLSHRDCLHRSGLTALLPAAGLFASVVHHHPGRPGKRSETATSRQADQRPACLEGGNARRRAVRAAVNGRQWLSRPGNREPRPGARTSLHGMAVPERLHRRHTAGEGRGARGQ